MGEKDKPKLTIQEWINQQEESTKEQIIKLKTLRDLNDEWQYFYGALHDIYFELNLLYSTLSIVYNDKNETYKKTDYLNGVLKDFLGLDSHATRDQINERAKEFGRFVKGIVEREKELEENR